MRIIGGPVGCATGAGDDETLLDAMPGLRLLGWKKCVDRNLNIVAKK